MTAGRLGGRAAGVVALVLSAGWCPSATAAAAAAAAERFTAVRASDDGQNLTLQLGDRSIPARRRKGQVGFGQVKLSDDGRHVGWLAMFDNCCTSYPVPMALVVMGATGRVHTFEGAQATFGWCFADSGRAVALMRSALHGGGPEQFELRRLSDGKLMRSHVTPVDRDGQVEVGVLLPNWAECTRPRQSHTAGTATTIEDSHRGGTNRFSGRRGWSDSRGQLN